MSDSEIYHTFNKDRPAFKSYGMTCELWTPNLMHKADRHNEIELNFFPSGSITYLVHDQKVTIPEKRLAVFWGLVPHQIIHFEEKSPYYVCTIPFAQFMEWNIPSAFVNLLLDGEVCIADVEAPWQYDLFLLENWIKDVNGRNVEVLEVVTAEIRARVSRLALRSVEKFSSGTSVKKITPTGIDLVEKIAIFIARNYTQSITTATIGKAVGLHPDYANTLFKKTFGRTLSEYLVEQRILHAQRQLTVTTDSITKVAYASGFNSISRFNVAFKKLRGCTPREFRKKF